MHIVLTAQFSPWSAYSGGGQRSTHNLATALSDRGHDVDVVFAKPPWETVAVPDELPYTVHWAVLPAVRSRRAAPLRPLTSVSVMRTVRALLRPGTVVHAQGEEAALLPWLRRRHPFVFVVTPRYPWYPRGLRADATWSERLRALVFYTKFVLLGRTLRAADCCCPTSEHAAHLLEQAYGSLPLRVIPNGVSSPFLQVGTGTVRDPRHAVFFGRLAPSKGVDTLVEALTHVRDLQLICTIIGRGEAEADVRRRVDELGLRDVVRLRGWMPPGELARKLGGAGLAVLPSREESFGNAVAEAMATGTPVVSTTAGSVPEVVGDAGVLVEPGDAEALGSALRHVVEDPARAGHLGRAGRERVLGRFTWPAVAERFERVYKELGGEAVTSA